MINCFVDENTNAVPIVCTTEAQMNAAIIAANEGKVYKYTGTSGTYKNGDYYVVRAVRLPRNDSLPGDSVYPY